MLTSLTNGADVSDILLAIHFDWKELTRQEKRIASMLASEHSTEKILGSLFITANTLKFHIRHINRKLGISSRKDFPALIERLRRAAGFTSEPGENVSGANIPGAKFAAEILTTRGGCG